MLFLFALDDGRRDLVAERPGADFHGRFQVHRYLRKFGALLFSGRVERHRTDVKRDLSLLQFGQHQNIRTGGQMNASFGSVANKRGRGKDGNSGFPPRGHPNGQRGVIQPRAGIADHQDQRDEDESDENSTSHQIKEAKVTRCGSRRKPNLI